MNIIVYGDSLLESIRDFIQCDFRIVAIHIHPCYYQLLSADPTFVPASQSSIQQAAFSSLTDGSRVFGAHIYQNFVNPKSMSVLTLFSGDFIVLKFPSES